MTTIDLEERSCAICGASHEYRVIRSTNCFGSPDLDLRPAEMQRSTMPMWIQQCPACAYCAPDVSKPTPGAADVLASDAYSQVRSDASLPDLAKSFLLLALLNESQQQVAAQARLRAAWVCDDAGLAALASDCRALAIESLAARRPWEDTEESVTEGAIYVDMLRRTGRFRRRHRRD